MKLRFIVPLIAALITFSAHGQETTITVKKSDSINITIQPFGGSDGAAAAKIVQNDLDLSGVFSLGVAQRANFVISATATSGLLQGIVTDNRGGTMLQKSYSGNIRSAAHNFSKDIVETLAGVPSITTSKIAFVANRTGAKEIYLADYDGGNQIQMTRDGTISVAPTIDTIASKIAYTGYQSGYADIYLLELASGSRRPIMKFPGTNSGASFSPDGSRIACTLSRDGNPELYIAGANGSSPRRLTRTRGVESSPTWSPDGSEIIYSSDQRGTPQLYRISAAGGTGRLIPTGFGYCTEPSWSPDGKKLAFTVRQGGFSIAVMDIATGATRVLAEGQDPSWGADSRHLIYSDGSSIILLDSIKGRRTAVVSGLGKLSEPSWSH